MRQEKTMKVIANHSVDPRITMTQHGGNDKSYVWCAFDFSDYELVEKVNEFIQYAKFTHDVGFIAFFLACYLQTFAIRFGSPEVALAFKNAFAAAQDVNKKILEGADATEGAKEADEAASAIESLNVKADSQAAEPRVEPEVPPSQT